MNNINKISWMNWADGKKITYLFERNNMIQFYHEIMLTMGRWPGPVKTGGYIFCMGIIMDGG